MAMKILAIYGSPRSGGNTHQLTDEFLNGCKSSNINITKIFLCDLKITPCMEHYVCTKTGDCDIDDDMTGLYKSLETADVVVLSSPIFFYGLTAQTKAFIDRGQVFWARKYILKIRNPKSEIRNRRGFFISTAATKGEKVFDGAKLTVKYFFDSMGIEYSGDLLVRLYKEKDDIKKHPTALKEALSLGQKLILS
jgi:multimeric flavodoxin WrbA